MVHGPARLGRSRLITIDGPAGSGKSTLAASLAAELGDTAVIHLDDLYDGWTGLNPELFARLSKTVLDPLRRQSSASFRRYDWNTQRFVEWIPVPARPHVIIEGVGAGDTVTRRWSTLKVWLDVSGATGLERGLHRDTAIGATPAHKRQIAANWATWQQLQSRYFAASANREAADLRFSTE